jgi:hypothetical protein
MASLPAGIRRVYNALYKRKASGSNSYTPTPAQIKEYFESQSWSFDHITDEQFNQAINYFSKGELSLHQESTGLNSVPTVDDVYNTESNIVLTEQHLKDIVTAKAAEMSIQLSTSDIEYVANQIDNQVANTLDDVLTQTENLLCAYADYKKQEGIQKIDAMFGRIYHHVQSNNEETSQYISSGLRQFGRDVEQGQQDFKSSVFHALERLKVPSVSA